MRIRFGEWSWDRESRELTRGGDPVHLSPMAFELLGLLLEGRPRALSKLELMRRLWPDSFVSEASLTTLVKEVRAVLGDDARHPRWIRTHHRFGYAFSGAADALPATAGSPGSGARGPAYRLIWGDRELALGPGESVLGRTPDAVAWIESPTVSRRHARILIGDDGARLEDLGSKNGTTLRGEPLHGAAPLTDGDEFRLGSVPFVLRVLVEGEPTGTAPEAHQTGRSRQPGKGPTPSR